MIRLEAPEFWYDTTKRPFWLMPFAALWRGYTRWRIANTKPYTARAKVVCIGNVCVGGAGKTPLAMALFEAVRDASISHKPCFLTRGFGGSTKTPTLINNDTANAIAYGDEALLLASHGPTIVAQDRVEGLKLADTHGFDLVIVDDGFQNPTFSKTFSILVFDGMRGVGNGLCLPAGPCREPLGDALLRASVIVIVGDDKTKLRQHLQALPAFAAHIKAAYSNTDTKYVAFAGIGRPTKFFETLAESNYKVVHAVGFPDHHAFDTADTNRLMALAAHHEARLITTEKDFVRLPDEAKAVVDVLPVTLKVDGMPELLTALSTKLQTP